MQKSGEKKTNAMEKEIYLVQSALSAKRPPPAALNSAPPILFWRVPRLCVPNCFYYSRLYPYYSRCVLAYGRMRTARCGFLTCGWKA